MIIEKDTNNHKRLQVTGRFQKFVSSILRSWGTLKLIDGYVGRW